MRTLNDNDSYVPVRLAKALLAGLEDRAAAPLRLGREVVKHFDVIKNPAIVDMVSR